MTSSRNSILILAAALSLTSFVAAPIAYGMVVVDPNRLTDAEVEILERGEITEGQMIGGGILGTTLGFGTGHAVQHRYLDRGLIITIGESLGLGTLIVGSSVCSSNRLTGSQSESCLVGWSLIGLVTFAGFKIYEIFDIWGTPAGINRRYRELKGRTNGTAPQVGLFPVRSLEGTDFAGAGLSLRWRF